MFSPDAESASSLSGSAAFIDTHVRHQENVPLKNAVLLSICQQADAKWKDSPFIMLVWKKEADFSDEVSRFATIFSGRQETGGDRQHLTRDLDDLDHQIDDVVPYVKSYINNKFGPKDGKSYFAAFGLTHSSAHGYELPHDRQGRKSSIEMMIKACSKYGFTAETSGANFWTEMQPRYDAAISKAATTSGDVSGYIGDLNTLRTTLRRVLHSILLLLEANFPDTFEQVRREWGFQKENY